MSQLPSFPDSTLYYNLDNHLWGPLVQQVKVKNLPILPEHLEILASIRPMSKRLIVTKPKVQEIKENRYIIIPETAKSICKEFGLETTVLKMAPDVTQDVKVGDTVLIAEFAGVPLVIDTAVPFWSIGEGDMLAVITPTIHRKAPKKPRNVAT
jgi:co-chaperonin GroES (HSP10)